MKKETLKIQEFKYHDRNLIKNDHDATFKYHLNLKQMINAYNERLGLKSTSDPKHIKDDA